MSKGLSDVHAIDRAAVYINQRGNRFDISSMITSINIQERISGDLTGMLEVNDDSGIIDNIIITGDEVVNITFMYFKIEVNLSFYFNGISNINALDKIHSKTYTIELGSVNEYISSTNLVSTAFEGLATDIIGKIFLKYFNNGELLTSTESRATGRYIAPNVSPKKALATLLKTAFDKNDSKILMFQKLIGNGNTFMESLFDLSQKPPVYKLSPGVVMAGDVAKSGPGKMQIGRPAKIVINDNVNLINKSATGVKGKTIDFIDISKSSSSKELFRGNSNPATNVIAPFRKNMYTDNVNPIMAKDDELNSCIANFQLDTLGSIIATAYDCPAVPGLSVGNVVELELDDRRATKINTPKMLSNKYSATWLVTAINHRITNGVYTQNITMSKGILE